MSIRHHPECSPLFSIALIRRDVMKVVEAPPQYRCSFHSSNSIIYKHQSIRFRKKKMSSSIISNLLSSGDPFISLANMCPVLSTPIDWKETPEAHVFVADLPGLTKEEVKVEVEDGRVLQISGEKKADETASDNNKNEKWHRLERNQGNFCRKFRLPENAKTDQVKASMENGVLTVTIPKQEVKKPVTKVIEIAGK